ncbi:MAG: substrate-binding domain-containing protein, partial [Anaerolineales bacterium]
MSKKLFRPLTLLVALFVIFSLFLAACGPEATTEAPVATEEEEMEEPEPTEEPVVTEELAVGIVLPTREEPRWIQDETRFRDAFTEQGYDVEILFSEGDSSRELTNVQNLITQGVQVIIITPHDATAAAAAAEAAHDAGVKV